MTQMGDMKDATHEDVMRRAKAKFNLLMNSGKWGAKSLHQEIIVVLEAQLKELEGLSFLPNLPTSSSKINIKDKTRENREPTQVRTKGTIAKIARTTKTSTYKRRAKNGRRCHPRTMNQNINWLARKHGTGAFTT